MIDVSVLTLASLCAVLAMMIGHALDLTQRELRDIAVAVAGNI